MFTVFWERDISSESHGTPVHISTLVYTFAFTTSFPFSCTTHIFPLCLILCKQQAREIDNLSELVGSKVICILVCRSTSTGVLKQISGAVATYLLSLESYWRQTLVSSPREIYRCVHHNLPLGVTNKEVLSAPIKTNFWGRCRGLQISR